MITNSGAGSRQQRPWKRRRHEMKKINIDKYMKMTDSYMGFCTTCQDFTRGITEPDAEEYDCPNCGKDTVMGTEQALLLGKIVIGLG